MMGGSGLGTNFWSFGAKAEKVDLSAVSLRRILAYFIPYKGLIALTLLVIAVAAGLGAIPPLLVRALLDQAIPHKDTHLLHLLAMGMIALPILGGLLGVLETYLDELVSQGVMMDLRMALYTHLQGQSMAYFTTTKPGELSSRLNNDVADLGDVFSDTLLTITNNVLVAASSLAVIFTLDPWLAAVAVGVIPLFLVPTQIVGRMRQRIVTATQESRSALSNFIQETMGINGFLMRRIFNRQASERGTYRGLSLEMRTWAIRRSLVWRWFMLFLTLFTAIGPAVVYWYGGYQVITGAMTIGTVVAFVAYLARLYGPMSSLANAHVQVMGSLAVFQRLFDVLDQVPLVQDRPGAEPLPPLAGHVQVDQLGFEYREGIPLLQDISFEAKPGQLIALVGPSGSGKTTLTYLLSRFYDPASGAIRFDSHDLRDVTLESIDAQVATVTQEPFLFHTSLRENLLYARPDASETDIIAACRAAHIHDVIAALPEGYDTVVGERGYRLSGGERQRIALARVILKAPRILILDEATASLDSQSEALIQQALIPLMAGRTTIAIAHRLSTVQHADLILVFEKGRIVERGTHESLLGNDGLYAKLYREQFKLDATSTAPSPIRQGELAP
ncbi:MAG: ABC transporter ATP-binding protein [Candidatus Sericytochromatia bacterium]|nr:ABC transporter ATP-binding protein [Candidatus Sericytochromatia bacterium]